MIIKLFWDEKLTKPFPCRHCKEVKMGTRNQEVCLAKECQKKEQRRMRKAQMRRKQRRPITV